MVAFDVAGTLRLGLQYQQSGRLREAEMSYRRVLEAQPDNPDALHLLGLLAQGAGRLDIAQNLIEKAVLALPAEAMFRHNLSNVLYAQGKLEAAAEQAGIILEQNPDFFEARFMLANILRDQGKQENSAQLYERVLAQNPTHVGALNNLGTVFMAMKKYPLALVCYEKLFSANVSPPECLNNYGVTLKAMGRHDEARTRFEQALETKPDYEDALQNLADLLQLKGDFVQAARIYRRALELQPSGARSHFGLAICLLAQGELTAGWEEYVWRFEQWLTIGLSKMRPFPQPLWSGEDLRGKTLLIWGEQGVGDEILFAGAIPDAVNAGARVIVECEPRLVELFSRSFPGAEVFPREAPPHPRVLEKEIDWQIPSGSLLRWFRPTLASFPEHQGYLVPDAERVSWWKDWLATLGSGPKVGIAWRSMLRGEDRDMFYTKLTQWGELLGAHGVTFVNLQYDKCQLELVDARQTFGVTIHEPPGINLKDDLDDAAALTAALDLVITAGTSVVAIAGAIGQKTWMYGLDSVWDRLGATHYPWMPSIHMYLKKWNEPWEPLLKQIGCDLEVWASGKRTP